ncbi:MAG: hypothetical protein ACRD9L_12095, partial [Bryobacteraceae bacterium]
MRASFWCLFLILAGCRSHTTSLEDEARSARELLRSEDYDRALTKAGDGLQRAAQSGDRKFEWRFRLLKAEILLARRDISQAAAVLNAAPPEGPAWTELRGRSDLLQAQVAYFSRDYARAST